jgi:hypothetical protein
MVNTVSLSVCARVPRVTQYLCVLSNPANEIGPGLMLATTPTPPASIFSVKSMMRCNLPRPDLSSSIEIQFVFNAVITLLVEVNVGLSMVLSTSSHLYGEGKEIFLDCFGFDLVLYFACAWCLPNLCCYLFLTSFACA